MSEILLGVSGGIAAYKSCDLLRRLQDLNHSITVVPTPAALNFVGRATWEALSGKPVHTQVWEAIDQVNHVQLGERAEYVIIAPATADLIARIAAGRADDLLTNSILASDAPKMIVPAMHPKMWLNAATQLNVAKLSELGFKVMPPATGRLTGNDSGIGRFPDTQEIIDFFQNEVAVPKDLIGLKVLVTAGGTREAIDDVRFLSNRSSGKQGVAIAKAAKVRGASVTVIAANLEQSLLTELVGINTIKVVNTDNLQTALRVEFPKCDVLLMAAAVSDARPKPSKGKIKKQDYQMLELETTPDLLADLAATKSAQGTSQFIVGFAAEDSASLLIEGKRKLSAKSLDLIYANDISGGDIFGADQTSGMIISKSGFEEVEKCSKRDLANRLLNRVSERLKSHNV